MKRGGRLVAVPLSLVLLYLPPAARRLWLPKHSTCCIPQRIRVNGWNLYALVWPVPRFTRSSLPIHRALFRFVLKTRLSPARLGT
jgi:hypothetical protein